MGFTPGGGGGIANASDVAISSAANNQVLTYDTSVAKWKNAAASGGGVALYRSVKSYGAVGNGIADDTSAINSAIAAGQGMVFFPAGTYITTGITLPMGVGLIGEGMWASCIKLKNASNGHVIKNYVSPDGVIGNGQFVSVQNLRIDGNKANQTGTSHGIFISTFPLYGTQSSGDVEFDMHHLFSNLYIHDALTDGFRGEGRSESRLFNVQVYDAGRYGIVPSFDSFVTDCTSGRSGASGFFLNSQSIRVNGCKSFFSGQNSGAADGAGFLIQDQIITLSNCCAQDNHRQGFLLNGCSRVVLSGCDADSNSRTNAGVYVGYDLYNSNYCRIDGQAMERKAYGTNNQTDAVKNTGGSFCSVEVMHSALNGAVINASGYKSGSTNGTSNHIQINNVTIV